MQKNGIIVKCGKSDYPALKEIWERSVRATHSFLTNNVINEIKLLLESDYFPNVDLYAINEHQSFKGFIGLSENCIEMLFIDSSCQRRGYGSMLIEFAVQKGATKVDVNEQNPSALEFYTHKGFHIIGRDERDEAGRPYPILHLSR